jgi:hypothetical protein
MLCWQLWNQAKGLGCRPSELYDIEWPLARFYFDRGIYWWGNYVEDRMNEAEATVRKQMKNRKGTETFVASQRIATFNKIFGLSVAAAYRQPSLPGMTTEKKKTQKELPKVTNTSGFQG